MFVCKAYNCKDLCKKHNKNSIEKDEHPKIRHDFGDHCDYVAQLLKDSKEEECLDYLH